MLEADTFVGLVTGHLTLSPDARRHRVGGAPVGLFAQLS